MFAEKPKGKTKEFMDKNMKKTNPNFTMKTIIFDRIFDNTSLSINKVFLKP